MRVSYNHFPVSYTHLDVYKRQIVLKGTTIGTASDVDGNFSLNIPKAGMVLQFSYVGMKNKELTVQGNGEFNIVMEYDQSDLDEVVVIGYGTVSYTHLAVLSSHTFPRHTEAANS